jgi:general secretion pathway protein A
MYERFYGLKERPFELTANPRYLFLTAKHREALSHLQYGVAGRKGITVLIGEAGTGKTTLVHAALGQKRGQNLSIVHMSNPVLTRGEFIEFLANAFGLSPDTYTSKTRFLIALTRTLIDRQTGGGGSALIIDEAQCLPHELLEEIRLLSNIETAFDKLLPIVLVGQPELADRLNEPALRQLKQRVALRCALPPLDAAETVAYVANRVSIAGGDHRQLFTAGAIDAMYEHSGGIPRTISVICDNALVSGFAADERPVSRQTVLEVCRDFDLSPQHDVEPEILAEAVPAAQAGGGAARARGSSFFRLD